MTTTVYPASQAFARAPDGGVLIGSPAVNFSINGQALPPPENTALLTSEPTPPDDPTEPALQATGPIPVAFELLPDYLDVDLSLVVPDTQDANTYVVTGLGNFPTVPQESVRLATIAAVVDYETGLPPSTSSTNLLVTLSPGSKSLTSYGVELTGRTLYFTSGAWIPAGTTPKRQIMACGALALVIPNLSDAGVSFDWSGLGGPGAGTVFAFDAQAFLGEVVSQIFPTILNIVPETQPVPATPANPYTLLPVPSYDVGDQELTVGTPVDYFQGIVHPA